MPKNKKLKIPIKKQNGGEWPKMPSLGWGSKAPSPSVTPVNPTNQGPPPPYVEPEPGSPFYGISKNQGYTPSPPTTPYPGNSDPPGSMLNMASKILPTGAQGSPPGSMFNMASKILPNGAQGSPPGSMLNMASKILPTGVQGQPGSSAANFMGTQFISPSAMVEPSAPPLSMMNPVSSPQSVANSSQTGQRANCPPCPTKNCNRPIDYSILSTISKFIEDGRLNHSNLSPKLVEKIKSLRYPTSPQMNRQYSQNSQRGRPRNMYNNRNYENRSSNPDEEIKKFQRQKKEILNNLSRLKKQQLELLNREINQRMRH